MLLLTCQVSQGDLWGNEEWHKELEITLPFGQPRELDCGISKVAIFVIDHISDVTCRNADIHGLHCLLMTLIGMQV